MAVKSLESCSAVITGGTSGIGLACAKALAAAGVPRLAINGRSAERGEAAAREIRGVAERADIRFMAADVSDAAAARDFIDQAAGALGGVDILVNCASSGALPRLFHLDDPAEFPRTYVARLGPVLNCCHAVLPHMKRAGGGAIINTASDAAKVATPGEAVIGAMMAAIVMFSRTLAMEASRDNIRVNALTPSIVQDTGVYRALMSDPFCSRLFGKAEQRARLGVAQPEDLAALVVFLAGPAGARLTGQAISVNGGISAA